MTPLPFEICDDEEDSSDPQPQDRIFLCSLISCCSDDRNTSDSKSITSLAQQHIPIPAININVDINVNNYMHGIEASTSPSINSDSPVTVVRHARSQNEPCSTVQDMLIPSITKEVGHDYGNPFK